MGTQARLAAAASLVEHGSPLAVELTLEDGDFSVVHLVWFVWYVTSIEARGAVARPLVTVAQPSRMELKKGIGPPKT